MKKFILRLLLFSLLAYVGGEIVVRNYQLVPDVPRRFVGERGIQRYINGQSGYFKNFSNRWQVNDLGWLGVADTSRKQTISIIGDSFIENMANPITSNQGFLLQEAFKDIGFVEAGRSGVTFIEALEISRLLDKQASPSRHLIYVSDNDFFESLVSIKPYKDRMQLDLSNGQIIQGTLKAPGLKKILYNLKFLYYLYLRFPIFVSAQNKGVLPGANDVENTEISQKLKSLLEFSLKNYDFSKIVLVFHPGTSKAIIDMAKGYRIKFIQLKEKDGKSWKQGEREIHWSVYGHQCAAEQVEQWIKKHMSAGE